MTIFNRVAELKTKMTEYIQLRAEIMATISKVDNNKKEQAFTACPSSPYLKLAWRCQMKKSIIQLAINKCRNFIDKVKENDIIVIPNAGSKRIAFARVGEYYEEDIEDVKEIEIVKKIVTW